MLHYLAPIPIIFGIGSVLLGVFWILAADAEDRDPPDGVLAWVFGIYYLGLRLIRACLDAPLNVLAGLGFVLLGIGLITLGVWMF